MTLKFEQLDSTRRQEFMDVVKGLAAGAPKKDQKTRLTVEIAGGPPTRRYQYRVEIPADGSAKYIFMDQLHKVGRKEVSLALARPEIQEVFDKIQTSRILEEPQKEYAILPDSLVCFITVEVDNMKKILYFPVEEDEGAAAEKGLPLVAVPIAEGTRLSLNRQKIAPSYLEILGLTDKVARRIKGGANR